MSAAKRLVAAGQSVARRTALEDAGGGAGSWTVTVQTLSAPAGTTLTAEGSLQQV